MLGERILARPQLLLFRFAFASVNKALLVEEGIARAERGEESVRDLLSFFSVPNCANGGSNGFKMFARESHQFHHGLANIP